MVKYKKELKKVGWGSEKELGGTNIYESQTYSQDFFSFFFEVTYPFETLVKAVNWLAKIHIQSILYNVRTSDLRKKV